MADMFILSIHHREGHSLCVSKALKLTHIENTLSCCEKSAGKPGYKFPGEEVTGYPPRLHTAFALDG